VSLDSRFASHIGEFLQLGAKFWFVTGTPIPKGVSSIGLIYHHLCSVEAPAAQGTIAAQSTQRLEQKVLSDYLTGMIEGQQGPHVVNSVFTTRQRTLVIIGVKVDFLVVVATAISYLLAIVLSLLVRVAGYCSFIRDS
jgi:hypothetical protein